MVAQPARQPLRRALLALKPWTAFFQERGDPFSEVSAAEEAQLAFAFPLKSGFEFSVLSSP